MSAPPAMHAGGAELSTGDAEATGRPPADVCTNRACERRDPKVDHAGVARDAVLADLEVNR